MNLFGWINFTLKENGIFELNEIQKLTIPPILLGKNIIGISRTGTGKTFCYLIPILEKINYTNTNIQAIIVSPTKELARQIYNQLTNFKKNNEELNISLLISGNSHLINMQKIRSHIIVATPQKLLQTIQNNLLNLKDLKTIVLDEADMLIDLGFLPLLNSVFMFIRNFSEIQKLAFSATIHELISNELKKILKNCEVISTIDNIWLNNNIKNHVVHYDLAKKMDVLKKLIKHIQPYFCIIFCNKKEDVDKLFSGLFVSYKNNLIKMHGDLSNQDRKINYKNLTSDTTKILIATDVASRGLDIKGVSHIISWEMPKENIWYIHRSGRTGRNNTFGDSYVFFDEQSKEPIYKLYEKGIRWDDLKFANNEFKQIKFEYVKKINKKKTKVDAQIRKIINQAPKKTKPNCKKNIKVKIKKVKQKAKRERIEYSMNKQRIKSYKIKNANKKKNTNSI